MVLSLVSHPKFERVRRKIQVPIYHYHYNAQKLLPGKTAVFILFDCLLFFHVLSYVLFYFVPSHFSVVFPILLFFAFRFHPAIRCFFLEIDMVSVELGQKMCYRDKYLLEPL